MRRYCLYCFTTLPDDSEICSHCGHASPPAVRRRFWSRHPRHRQDEVAVKIAVVVIVLLAGAVIVWWVGSGPATGPGAGWLLVLPVAFGAALWNTAEKMTRHRTAFRPAVFWGALGACCAALLGWFHQWGFAGLALAAALATVGFCRAAREWKRALMMGERTP